MTIEMDLLVEPDGAELGERSASKQRNPSARHQALLELMKLFPETPLRLVAPDLQLGYPVRGRCWPGPAIPTRTGCGSAPCCTTTPATGRGRSGQCSRSSSRRSYRGRVTCGGGYARTWGSCRTTRAARPMW